MIRFKSKLIIIKKFVEIMNIFNEVKELINKNDISNEEESLTNKNIF